MAPLVDSPFSKDVHSDHKVTSPDVISMRMRSGGGASAAGSAAEVGALEGRGQVGRLVRCADVGAGRDDLVDPIEDLVAEPDVDAGEQVVKLLHRARPDDRAGDAAVSD